jgi:F420-dependent oxidoreductase-like protein
MRIGIMIGEITGTVSLDQLIGQVQVAADAGLDTAWQAQLTGLDALTAIAVVGRAVPGIRLGTAVVPTYPRHPIALASQALTVQAAIGNRLRLGIGPSHAFIVEERFGYSFERPVRHVREYLAALEPLLRGESVDFRGATLKASGTVTVPGAERPELLVAALGPAMLRLTGRHADGTVTWMTGPATIENHIVPTLTSSAAEAGRPAPTVIAGVPICVTDDPDRARTLAARLFARYAQAPSYRAMLDREGVAEPGEIAIVGDEPTVERALRHLIEIGATEILALPFGQVADQSRTIALLGALAHLP